MQLNCNVKKNNNETEPKQKTRRIKIYTLDMVFNGIVYTNANDIVFYGIAVCTRCKQQLSSKVDVVDVCVVTLTFVDFLMYDLYRINERIIRKCMMYELWLQTTLSHCQF